MLDARRTGRFVTSARRCRSSPHALSAVRSHRHYVVVVFSGGMQAAFTFWGAYRAVRPHELRETSRKRKALLTEGRVQHCHVVSSSSSASGLHKLLGALHKYEKWKYKLCNGYTLSHARTQPFILSFFLFLTAPPPNVDDFVLFFFLVVNLLSWLWLNSFIDVSSWLYLRAFLELNPPFLIFTL